MLLRELDRIVVGKERLQDDLTGDLSASGTSRYLCQQLKCSLGGAEIRKTQREVRAHYTDQRHAMDVVAFGHHLRADQDVNLAGIQLVQHSLEIMPSAHCVAIQSADARRGKCL